MPEKVIKTYIAKIGKVDEKEHTVEAVLSTGIRDRDDEVISPAGWDLKHFKQHPVLVANHNYRDLTAQIGEWRSMRKTEEGLVGKAKYYFGEGNPEADWAWNLATKGRAAFSVGFIPKEVKEAEKEKDPRRTYVKAELLEGSQVVVPANPEALQMAIDGDDPVKAWIAKGIQDEKEEKLEEEVVEIKKVIPYKETPKAPEDAPWEAGAEVRQAEISDLKIMCTWVNAEAPDVKGSYKLPHHKASGSHAVVWRGVAAAMAALLGARGGVNIPASDKRGVYNHLAKHYKQFDKPVPEFRNYSEADLKDIVEQFGIEEAEFGIEEAEFGIEEAEIWIDSQATDDYKALERDYAEMAETVDNLREERDYYEFLARDKTQQTLLEIAQRIEEKKEAKGHYSRSLFGLDKEGLKNLTVAVGSIAKDIRAAAKEDN